MMTLKDLIFPPSCVFCGKIMDRNKPCEECLKQATELTATVCNRCGAYPEDCSCMGREFFFTRNISCFIYEKSPRNLLLRYKLRYKPQLAKFIARRMYYHIRARLGSDFSMVVYVPQSRRARIRRGFSPTKEFARLIAKYLGVECCCPLRRVGSLQQKYVASGERWANAKRNYTLLPGKQVHGRVLLVDDLFTTGATLNACAELLKLAGAEEVVCGTFAIKAKKS